MRRRPLALLVVVVAGGGAAALTALPWVGFDASAFQKPAWPLLAAYIVICELRPLRVPRGDREGQLTVSTTFAFATLLLLGAVPALVPLVAASVAVDLTRRAPLSRIAFNAGQYVLSITAAAAVLRLLDGPPHSAQPFFGQSSELLVAAAAAVAFFAVNFVLTGAVLGLATPTPILGLLRRDVGSQALWSAVLLSLAPVVVAAAQTSPLLLPLFIVPMIAVYRSMEIFLARAHQALHDALTGLPNRMLFADRLHQAVLATERSSSSAAVLVVDFDGFKDVNDTLGHRAGDDVLRAVSKRMAGALRAADTVARLGGDEFGVVVGDIEPSEVMRAVVPKLQQAMTTPIEIAGLSVALDASVGAAFAPRDSTDPDVLVRYADAAMFRAKRHRTGVETHDPALFRESENRMLRLAGLREALQDGRIVVHYQPQVQVRTGRITGAEALVRYRTADDDLVMPNRFIALAEESGLIRDLTTQVLEQVLVTLRRLHDEGLAVPVSVNVSARDIADPTLPEQLVALLDKSGVPADLLEVEITERTMMADPRATVEVVHRLHTIGVSVAIDDFGTGTTSLSLLSELPADCLKIDGALVRGMASGGTDAHIVETTIDLGHRLGMTVVAEGVESIALYDRLRDLDCDVAQGFACSEPVPDEDLAVVLRAQR